MKGEFRLTEPHALRLHGARRARYTAARFRRLAAIAAKLCRAGWPVWSTMTGLAFEAPGTGPDWAFEDEDEWEEQLDLVDCRLADLGIDEEFDPDPGKTVDKLPDGWAMWMWDPSEG
jgi:hypothetical protein